MRSFLFTLLLFGVMLTGIAGNAIFIHRLGDEITQLIDTLPTHVDGQPNETLQQLTERWVSARKWVSLSVSYSEMNRITQGIVMLGIYYAEGNDADYHWACEQLRLAIDDMRRFERLELDNLI